MTYVQTIRYTESRFTGTANGEVVIRFAVSDIYNGGTDDGLFANDDHTINVGCIEFDRFRRGESRGGKQATDEFTFAIAAAQVATPDDQSCRDFILDAQNVTNRRFVALFINPFGDPTSSDLRFVGVVQSAQDADDQLWHGAEFAGGIAPLRDWKFVAKTVEESTLDEMDMADLMQNPSDGVLADEDWGHSDVTDEDALVADRLGYFERDLVTITSGLVKQQVRFAELINLNEILDKLRSVVQARMRVKLDVPTFTITIDTAVSPVKFTAARYASAVFEAAYTRYSMAVKALAADAREVKIGAPSDVTPPESPWISWRMFTPGDQAKALSVIGQCKTFTDLIYALAYALGFMADFSYTDVDQLHIKFTPLHQFAQESVYLPDATQANVKTQEMKNSDRYHPSQLVCSYALEGKHRSLSLRSTPPDGDWYEWRMNEDDMHGYPKPSTSLAERGTLKGKPLLFTVGNVLKWQFGDNTTVTADLGNDFTGGAFPHNSIWYSAGHRQGAAGDYEQESFGAMYPEDAHIDTRIYLLVDGIEDGAYGRGTDGKPVWLNAAQAHADGQSFPTLSGAINHLTRAESDAYEVSYSLTVPYLCRFRASPTGTEDWRNLEIGRVWAADDIEYVVKSFEYSFKDFTTKIDFDGAIRYAFADGDGLEGDDEHEIGVDIVGVVGMNLSKLKKYRSAEAIGIGDALALDGTTERVVRAKAHHAFFRKVVGIAFTATTGADQDITVKIAPGMIQSPRYDFSETGEAVYLRTSSYPAVNIALSPLKGKSVRTNEDYFLCLGRTTASNAIAFDALDTGHIYHPPLDTTP